MLHEVNLNEQGSAALSVRDTYALVEGTVKTVITDAHSYLQAVAKYPVLTAVQESELAAEYRASGSRRAAMALVCCHLRQVVGIVRTYSGYGLPELDLIQEGNIGLMKAVKNFDPKHKARLSTYATYWIKAAINEYVIRNWKIVKVATTSAQRKLFFNLRQMTQKLGRRLGLKDVDNIAKELDVPQREVIEMEKRMMLPVIAFDSDPNIREDEVDYSPAATYAADDGIHAELSVIDQNTKDIKIQALNEALTKLPERERLIIEQRALSPSGKDVKLGVIAKRMGITAERVRQLEKKALQKIETYVLANCGSLAD